MIIPMVNICETMQGCIFIVENMQGCTLLI